MSAGPTVVRGRYRDAFAHRDFRLLTGATLVDQVGGWAYSVVLAVYLFDRTGSATVLALSASSRWIPALLLSGYASVLADRYERTLVMRTSALASSALMVLLAVGVALDAAVPLLLGLSALSAVAIAPYAPAAGALTPEVVGEKDLAAANGVFGALDNLVVVLGPAVGGLILLFGTPVLGVALNAVTFLLAALLLTRLRVRSTGDVAQEGGNALTQWLTGVKALVSQRTAVVLVVFAALDSAVYGASTVIYVPLSLELGTGSEGYSYLLMGAALGGVLGAGLANRLSAASRLAPVILISILIQTLPYLLTLFAREPAVAFALQVVSGIGMIVVDVLALTALQRDLPRAVLGRVLGVFDALVVLSITLASLGVSLVLRAYGLDAALLTVGLVIPLLALLGLPELLRADRHAAGVAAALRPRVELLGALDLLTGTDRTTLERLAAQAEPVELEAGSVLLREGEAADALYVLTDGTLAVTAAGAGAIPDVLAPGYVGELGLLHRTGRTATVTAATSASLLRLPGEAFLDALADFRASASLLSIAGTRLSRTGGARVAEPDQDTPAAR